MQKYFNSVTDLAGNAISGAAVTVTLASTGAAALLFSDSAGTKPLANVQTGTDGGFSFFAANGRYNISITKTGLPSQVATDVLLYDPADINDNGVASRLTLAETNIATLTSTVNSAASSVNAVEDKVDVLYSSNGARNIWATGPVTVQSAIDTLNAANFLPAPSAVPTAIGNMVFELTSDTTLKIKVMGSDGVIRSTTLTLA
jgi:hypothetical protein